MKDENSLENGLKEIDFGNLDLFQKKQILKEFDSYYIEFHKGDKKAEGIYHSKGLFEKPCLRDYTQGFHGGFDIIDLSDVSKAIVYKSWGKMPFEKIDEKFSKNLERDLSRDDGVSEYSTIGLPSSAGRLL